MINKVLIFTLGAAAGSLLTWKIVERKYKKLADEEIKSVIEHFSNRDKTEFKIKEHYVETNELDDTVTEYTHMVNDLGYSKEATVVEKEIIEPFTISPDEFGENDDYRTETWTYYSDFVLTDENDEIISEPEHIIGDGLKHFGEYEDADVVFVRNVNLKCDYEILKYYKPFVDNIGEDY